MVVGSELQGEQAWDLSGLTVWLMILDTGSFLF